MKQIACLGSEAFTLGFRLAGVRRVVEHRMDIRDEVHEIKKMKDVAIVIVEEEILHEMDSDARESVDDCVEPVFIAVSSKSESESIRKLIIRSIGVDIWKGD